MTEQRQDNNEVQLELTAEIVSAYVANNPVPAAELSGLIDNIHKTLTGLAAGVPEQPVEAPTPAVPVKKSVTGDYLVCLEDGMKFKSLKRHLASQHGITPEEYRARWGLPADYPMTAPSYSSARSALAKEMGLGRKPAERPEAAPAPKPASAPARARKPRTA